MSMTQTPTDADLARAWGYREGYLAFVDLDVPVTREHVFREVVERYLEEGIRPGDGLRRSRNAAESAAMGAVERLEELAVIADEPDPFAGHVEYWPGARAFVRGA